MNILSLSKNRIIYYSASVILFGCITVSSAQASQIDFNIAAPTSGSIDYAGGATPLIGSDIDIDDIVGLGTALHNNVISACDVCTLSFTTGVLDNYDASTSTWTFTGGGSLEVVGGVDFADNSSLGDIPVGTTLLLGSFSEAKVIGLPTGEFQFNIFGGSFNATANSDLATYYGLPGSVEYLGGLNISFSTSMNSTGGFNSTELFSGDVVTAPVPLPASVWFLISALATLSVFRRKRIKLTESQPVFAG